MITKKRLEKLKSATSLLTCAALFISTAILPPARASAAISAERAAGLVSPGAAAGRSVGVQPIELTNAAAISGLSLPASAANVPMSIPATATNLATPTAADDANDVVPQAPSAFADTAPVPSAAPAAEGKERGLMGWLRAASRRLTGLDASSGRHEFDAAATAPSAQVEVSGTSATHNHDHSALSRRNRIDKILNDTSIPTPEAARRVGAIEREVGTPLWAKVVAPLSVAAAVFTAFHFGVVPALTLGVGLLISVLLHEASHLAVLRFLGDHTAEHAGDHSLNPFHHIDAVKTIIVPALSLAVSTAAGFPLLLGAGKAVKVDFNNLHGLFGGPRSSRNAFWVAAAGPVSHFALAAGALALAAVVPVGGGVALVALGIAKMNLAMGIFNLIPLPQLDGGKMLVSVFPNSWYTRWATNSRVDQGYQRLYSRFYNGPSSILNAIADKLGIKSQTGINRFANAVTFAALGTVYAVAYLSFGASIPLLFLALQCEYDYYCIREKVRSDEAVKEVMKLFREWTQLIRQLSDAKGLESYVDLHKTEHAMKDALEDLIDELWSQPEFRALPISEQIQRLMDRYRDAAAKSLKEKVFTDDRDSIETIREMLNDPRHAPYYDAIRKWLADNDVFARWKNPAYEEKLRDALKDAGREDEKAKPSEKSAGGGGNQRGYSTVSTMIVLAGVGVVATILLSHGPLLLAAAGGAGVLGALGIMRPRDDDEFFSRPVGVSTTGIASRIVLLEGDPNRVEIIFRPGTSVTAVDEFLAPFGVQWEVQGPGAPPVRTRVIGDPQLAGQIARIAANNSLVAMVRTGEAVRQIALSSTSTADSASPAAASPAGQSPLRLDESRVYLVMKSGISLARAREFTRQYGEDGLWEVKGSVSVLVMGLRAGTPQRAAEIALAAQANGLVTRVNLSEAGQAILDAMHPAPTAAEAAPAAPAAETAPVESAPEVVAEPVAEPVVVDHFASDSRPWAEKVSVNGDAQSLALTIHLNEDAPEETRQAIVDRLKTEKWTRTVSLTGDELFVLGNDVGEIRDRLDKIAGWKAVKSIVISNAVHDARFAKSLPQKITAFAKDEWSTGAVIFQVLADASLDDIVALLGESRKSMFRRGERFEVDTDNPLAAVELAKKLAGSALIASLELHPNAAALLENRRVVPFAEAKPYNHAQSLLVTFKPDSRSSDEKTEARRVWAEQRGLRLLSAKFPGQGDAVLYDIPLGADARATAQILIDESLLDDSIVATVRPLRQTVADVPLSPSPTAVAAAVARQKGEEIAAAKAVAAKPARDVQVAWDTFLQNFKLKDGTGLSDEQVDLMRALLRPIAKNDGDPVPPIVGRTNEVKNIVPVVTAARGGINSAMMLGKRGTGKTAIAEGLAELIEEAEEASSNDADTFLDLERLKGRWAVELDLDLLFRQESPVGALAELTKTLALLNTHPKGWGNDVIVLIDEIHRLFTHRDGQNLTNALKKPLRNGTLSVIGATTNDDYKKYMESDEAFGDRMIKVDVSEFSVEQTIRALKSRRRQWEQEYATTIPKDVIEKAAQLTHQFDTNNANPRKSIKALTQALEFHRPENLRTALVLDIRETWDRMRVAVEEAVDALNEKGIPSILSLPTEAYNRILAMVQQAMGLYDQRDAVARGEMPSLLELLRRAISQTTGITSGQLTDEDPTRYLNMEAEMSKSVINQDRAIRAMAEAIRRNKAGIDSGERPMGKFLLAGLTGVGKTLIAKRLAHFLFGDAERIVRIDMTEYMQPHSDQRLIGAPPGYVGHEDGGQLTNAVLAKPNSIVLLDEIEKAHPNVLKVLLPALDDGRMTDGKGRTVDFRNTVFIMTSNAGTELIDSESFAKRIREKLAAGDAAAAEQVSTEWNKEIEDKVAVSLKRLLAPEFLNRLDPVPTAETNPSANMEELPRWIVVNRLRPQDMRSIAQIQLDAFGKMLAQRIGAELVPSPAVVDFLAQEGFSLLYGARPMIGAVDRHIKNPLSRLLLEEMAEGVRRVRGGLIRVEMKDGKVVFQVEPKPEAVVERVAVIDAPALVAAELFDRIEDLAREGAGEELANGDFDKMVRAARQNAPAAAPKKDVAPDFFLRDAASPLSTSAVGHPVSSKAETAAAAKAVDEAVAKGEWDEKARAALVPMEGEPGESWIPYFAAYARKRTAKGANAPKLAFSADQRRVVVSIHFDGELSASDRAYLDMHFTGTAPESLEKAQSMVDHLNVKGDVIRDHYLYDLHGRLQSVPGGRFGYAEGAKAVGGKGVDLWVEFKRPVEVAAAAEPVESKTSGVEDRRYAKLRVVLQPFLDESKLEWGKRNGAAIQIAAGDSFARIAGPAQLEEVRGWFSEYKWDVPSTGKTVVMNRRSQAIAALRIIQRLGGKEDIARLEAMVQNMNGAGFTQNWVAHDEVPVRNALVAALTELYRRAGLAEVRAAGIRLSQITSNGVKESLTAHSRALGYLGYPVDLEVVKRDARGLLELYRRMGRLNELTDAFMNERAFTQFNEVEKAAAMMAVGEMPAAPPAVLHELLRALNGGRGDRPTAYLFAQAWADQVVRQGRLKGLGEEMSKYLRQHSISDYSDSTNWAALYAFVLAAEKGGGEDVLKPLEDFMSLDPSNITPSHEQAYFSTPEAWANALLRSGKLREYNSPTISKDGGVGLSKLQTMLLEKKRPMMVAAALRAIALALEEQKPKAATPTLDVPKL